MCITCHAGRPLADMDALPGRALYDALAAHPDLGKVDLQEVACLAACSNGCVAAISMEGKWRYLLGRLDAALAGDLLAYAAAYAAHPSGTVLPSKRPASLAQMILGRMPA